MLALQIEHTVNDLSATKEDPSLNKERVTLLTLFRPFIGLENVVLGSNRQKRPRTGGRGPANEWLSEKGYPLELISSTLLSLLACIDLLEYVCWCASCLSVRDPTSSYL